MPPRRPKKAKRGPAQFKNVCLIVHRNGTHLLRGGEPITDGDEDHNHTRWHVTTVRVVCHDRGERERGSRYHDNHWTVFLDAKEGSFRLNMEAGDTIDGCVSITEVDEKFTDILREWSFETKNKTVTVRDFADNIGWTNCTYLYTMAERGQGCRFWTWIVLCDFTSEKWIDVTQDNGDWSGGDAMCYRYSPRAENVELDMGPGKFHGYDPDDRSQCVCKETVEDCQYMKNCPYGPLLPWDDEHDEQDEHDEHE